MGENTMATWVILAALIGAAVLVIMAIAIEWRESGPFRAITYGGLAIVLWGLHDHVKSYGWKKTLLGHSKEEFAELTRIKP